MATGEGYFSILRSFFKNCEKKEPLLLFGLRRVWALNPLFFSREIQKNDFVTHRVLKNFMICP